MVVEDLYRPYRPKRRTRATVAKEKGLEGLAEIIKAQETDKPISEHAKDYLSEEKEVNTIEEAVAGAMDIIAEEVSDEAEFRSYIREVTMKEGKLTSTAKDENAESVYEMYYNYEEDIDKMPGHRVLAINRGENEKILTVKITAPEERIFATEKKIIIKDNPNTNDILRAVLKTATKD